MSASAPRHRADCERGPRPCPWVRCRHHLLVDATDAGSLKAPGLLVLKTHSSAAVVEAWIDRILSRLEPDRATCTLDLAGRGESTLEQVSEVMGITRERVRQIEDKALTRLIAEHGCLVGDLLGIPRDRVRQLKESL